jgi:hypothetical protein
LSLFLFMMKFLRIFIGCCFINSNLFAQTPKAIENDLLASFKKISYWENQRYKDTSFKWVGQLEKVNELFGRTLKSYTEKYPSTITYPFNSLKMLYLDISNSTDGLFRIYSWDTLTGGTMHFVKNVFQYKVGDKTL